MTFHVDVPFLLRTNQNGFFKVWLCPFFRYLCTSCWIMHSPLKTKGVGGAVVRRCTEKMRRYPLTGAEGREREVLFSAMGPRTAWVSRPFIIPHPSVMRRRKADVRERKRKNRPEEGKKKRKRRLIELCGDRVWMSQWRAAIVLLRPQFGTVRSSFYCTVSSHNASFLLLSTPSLS